MTIFLPINMVNLRLASNLYLYRSLTIVHIHYSNLNRSPQGKRINHHIHYSNLNRSPQGKRINRHIHYLNLNRSP
jgi:hypothetical protein